MLTLTHRVVATRAAAIRAVAHRTRVRTVWAATSGAFVVVHSLVGAMLAVHVAIMQVVHVVGVQHRFVSTPWAMGVRVVLGLSVLDRGHGGLPLRMDHSMLICAVLNVKASDGRPKVRLRPMRVLKQLRCTPSDQRRTRLGPDVCPAATTYRAGMPTRVGLVGLSRTQTETT